VAGVNALGRGQDRESLGQFLQILAQTIGPESISTFINTDELIKRFAAAQGIDILNLVRSMEDVQAERQQAVQQQQLMESQKLAVDAMKTPMMDPTKNPNAGQPPTE
jgi:hypothetical protein